MPSAEDYAIRDRVFGKAMADANWTAEIFLQQDHIENVLSNRVKEEKKLSEELDEHVKADER